MNDFYLAHHGILGQKWGVRRFQPYPKNYHGDGKFVGKESNERNINSWGKDPTHNILFITGSSGSGKTTEALNRSNNNTTIISLDYFTEKERTNFDTKRYSNRFINHLNKNLKDWKQLPDNIKNRNGKKMDEFSDEIEKFAKDEFKQGKKVIVEGVQLSDDTFWPDKSYFNDKPFINMDDKIKHSIGGDRRMNETEDILAHHGILGMHWGIRRFQPYPKGERVKGGKEVGEATKVKQRSDSGPEPTKSTKPKVNVSEKISSVKTRIKEKRKEKAEAEEAKAREEKATNLEKVINSGNPKLVNQYKHEMTSNQLRDAITRVELDKKISSYSQSEKKDFYKTFDSAVKYAKLANDAMGVGINIYRAGKTIQGLSGAKKGKQDKDIFDRIMNSGYSSQGGGSGGGKKKKK